ncbi:myristylated protein [Turkeypox virus]|uniref:Myristylated protein n=1 Tax=Turkeypox virus TaxID=336486 RepID=A0A0M3ZPM2_9POXV|nr:myristylated protein [Turkeypox virus]ALA62464.1 myristylated protein [Turkeypox virus]
MGSGLILPEKPRPIGIDTAETLSSIPKLLHAIPGSKLGESLRIGYASGKEDEIRKTFPEFDIAHVVHGLYEIRRRTYLGDTVKCCTSPQLAYYWENNDKTSPVYTTGSSLKTCDPLTKNFSSSTVCDNIMTNLCSNFNSKIDRKICNEWLGSALTRPDPKMVENINNHYINICSKGADNYVCEDWIHHLRVVGGKENDDLIDNILMQQRVEFKERYMKCSFPNQDTILLSNRIIEPRECWDKECISSNIHFVLSKNYHNLSLCHIYRCNVSINNLILDSSSSIRISCHDETLLIKVLII